MLLALFMRCCSPSPSKIIDTGAIWIHVLLEDGWSPAPRNSAENLDALEASDPLYSGPREDSGEGREASPMKEAQGARGGPVDDHEKVI